MSKEINIVILDNNDKFYTLVKENIPDAVSIFLSSESFQNIFEQTKSVLLFINTSIINSTYKYRFERGGLEFIKQNMNILPKDSRIVFFSYEAKENMKQHLKNSWLKYNSRYFIHYPFTAEEVKNIVASEIPPLKTTDIFRKEIHRTLLKLLSSVKHDLLNRVARILPDLKAFRSAHPDGGEFETLDMDFKPEFLRDEIIKLAVRLEDELHRNRFNYDNFTAESLKKISLLLKKLPETFSPFIKKQKATPQLMKSIELFIGCIDDIKHEFENIIGYLRDGEQ